VRKKRSYRVGDWVEVRSKEEILTTLDSNGQLDGMPFMPEMFAFCGRRFKVFKRAHKTCDTVFPIRGRRVDSAVHLETRCDGHAHGGCQAGCLIFWKEVWLKPVSGGPSHDAAPHLGVVPVTPVTLATVCTEANIREASFSLSEGTPTYTCQATQLPYATSNLVWWDVRQYIEDYLSGNVGLWRIFTSFVYSTYYNLSQAGIGLGPAMRWLYDSLCVLWGGSMFPRRSGSIPEGQPTPTEPLNLQPGELVRVKSHEKILQTVTTLNRNRGLSFDAEMVPYCGGTYRVLKRVTKLIEERTGKMLEMKNPCIILDSVICQARYSSCRLHCPRSLYPFWREIWLERVVPLHISESVATQQFPANGGNTSILSCDPF
jgi:hypothetical protein